MQTHAAPDQTGHRCQAGQVGATLRALRLEAGVTQAVLARKLGTTQSAVARMEGGQSRTSLESVERAAAALGCEMDLVFERQALA